MDNRIVEAVRNHNDLTAIINVMKETPRTEIANPLSNLANHEDWNPIDSWTDQRTHYWEPTKRPNKDAALNMAKNLLHWWAGGNATVTTLYKNIVGVWASMEMEPGVHFFVNDLYQEEAESLTAPNINAPADVNTWVLQTGEGRISGPGTSSSVEGSNGTLVSVQDCLEWYTTTLALFSPPTEQESPEAKITRTQFLINYMGYQSMNLARSVTKDPASVSKHILAQTKARMTNFFGAENLLEGVKEHAPPISSRLLEFKNHFAKGTTWSKKLLYPILRTWELTHSDITKGMLKASCILSLSFTGLSVLNWFFKSLQALKVKDTELFPYLAWKSNQKFIVDYINLMDKMNPDPTHPGRTWQFCRLFNDSALAAWSVDNYQLLTAIFVTIAEGAEDLNNPIWSAPHLGRIAEDKKRMGLEIGKRIRMDKLKREISNPASDEATDILAGLSITSLQRQAHNVALDDSSVHSIENDQSMLF